MNWIYFISDYIHVPSKKFRKQLFTAAMTWGVFLLAIFLNAWQVFSSRPMADLTWSDVDFDLGLYIRPATTWFIASCGHKAAGTFAATGGVCGACFPFWRLLACLGVGFGFGFGLVWLGFTLVSFNCFMLRPHDWLFIAATCTNW